MAGYQDVLDLCRVIQVERRPIGHLHYSGMAAHGTAPIEELLHAGMSVKQRNRRLLRALIWEASGMRAIQELLQRATRKARRIAQGPK